MKLSFLSYERLLAYERLNAKQFGSVIPPKGFEYLVSDPPYRTLLIDFIFFL